MKNIFIFIGLIFALTLAFSACTAPEKPTMPPLTVCNPCDIQENSLLVVAQ